MNAEQLPLMGRRHALAVEMGAESYSALSPFLRSSVDKFIEMEDGPAPSPLDELNAANLDGPALNVFIGALAGQLSGAPIDRDVWTRALTDAQGFHARQNGTQ